ncbi:CatB-related O-acetyltransferase [Aquabacterium sp.]|uniref:CatB-related O-acetyltransferase n=1 Tax=Aquabacterium sp. TaxID=1872578 RepID=UPI002486DFA6|nr:CatB-related O-acetyltransferase [Aquabacterium sp.]MDI1259749.1 CatB-related O-acetyltransferase [Aquabacterium sp.]
MTALDPNLPRYGVIGNSKVSFGRFNYGTQYLSIHEWGEGASFSMGSFCSIASNITIFLGGNHRTDWITTFPFGHVFQEQLGGMHIKGHPATKGDVVIGNDVWIGHHSTIMSGVTIGDGAVIGAHAVVIKNVEPYAIVGGNPAKHVRFRFEPEICELLGQFKWWELPVDDIKAIAEKLSAQPTVELLQALIDTYKNTPRTP